MKLLWLLFCLTLAAQEIPTGVQSSGNGVILGVTTNTTPNLNCMATKQHVQLNWVVSPMATGDQEIRMRTDSGQVLTTGKHKMVLALHNGYWMCEGNWKGPAPVATTRYSVRIGTNQWSNEIEVKQ